jgi:DNA-binding MarR family transcriptional regulator
MGSTLQSDRETLTHSLVDLVERISTQMRSFATEDRPEMELTMPQFKTLSLLAQGPERMGNIAGYLNTSLSSATSMIDRLVEKNLVERTLSASDRRVVTCQLTTRGIDEMDRFLRLYQLQFTSIADRLTVQELQLVVEAMEILCAATQKTGQES